MKRYAAWKQEIKYLEIESCEFFKELSETE
jgi:hypothetical protein